MGKRNRYCHPQNHLLLTVADVKKLILIFVVLFVLSCRQNPKAETTSFDTKFEILYGRVKQLQEFYRAGKEAGGDTDITDFDIHGNLVQTKRTGSSNAI